MKPSPLNVLFTPADFDQLRHQDLSGAVCVVFDVLRATSTMLTALANGAREILAVSTLLEAVQARHKEPDVLLGGERDGVRIRSALTGGIDFDFGNSPLECTREKVGGRKLVTTTTNGTRALRACEGARSTLVACFLNLGATATWLCAEKPPRLVIICSGTYEGAAYEDILAAGGLCELVWKLYGDENASDSARVTRDLFRLEKQDLAAALGRSKNGRRLLSHPELRWDVPWCAQQDIYDFVAVLAEDGLIRRTQ